ncbi:39S ribosomal protein L43, mitochondrial [Alligator mississippiensis]|uniref:Large ribosomal subunit protein mL43 n=1 Tax=Alligator mississippiensis TaxID=8496 RepID=A0A151NV72_ALLMI|nr:39S ribosomal protein L43, mitochondrial [Alligator mississippiensis]
MTGRGTPSRFLASVLRNGLGRYVCQLQRLSLHGGDGECDPLPSPRDYVEEKVVDFARYNPGIAVYVNPKDCQGPTVVAEYLNGAVREESVANQTAEDIAQLIGKLANQSGLEIVRIRKPFHTNHPSIQGQWHPFTNKPSGLGLQTLRRVHRPGFPPPE